MRHAAARTRAPRLPAPAFCHRLRAPPQRLPAAMNLEKIRVRATSTGQVIEVTVFDKRAECIQVVIGEGVHGVRCDLVPNRNGTAYAGNAMGREIVYERSREEVRADLARVAGYREFRR